jgi:hypothetical protein
MAAASLLNSEGLTAVWVRIPPRARAARGISQVLVGSLSAVVTAYLSVRFVMRCFETGP